MARRRRDDESERRIAAIKVQLTPSERAELDRRAAMTGLQLSEFCRVVLLSDVKAPAPPARDPDLIRKLMNEIMRVGSNLNQLARIANERRDLPRYAELKAVEEKIVAALERVIEL